MYLLLFGWIRDPGSGMGKNPDPGSGINIPDPQHWIILDTKLKPKYQQDHLKESDYCLFNLIYVAVQVIFPP